MSKLLSVILGALPLISNDYFLIVKFLLQHGRRAPQMRKRLIKSKMSCLTFFGRLTLLSFSDTFKSHFDYIESRH